MNRRSLFSTVLSEAGDNNSVSRRALSLTFDFFSIIIGPGLAGPPSSFTSSKCILTGDFSSCVSED